MSIDPMPNKSPEPTAVGAVRFAVAVHVTSRRGGRVLVLPVIAATQVESRGRYLWRGCGLAQSPACLW